ncbi:MAG: ArsC/Spx/MgsR family protein [Bacteroidota bacterium]
MKTIFYLESCKTCQKILEALQPLDGVALREIKSKGVTSEELETLRSMTDSYESLFSRRAMLFRQRGLNNQELGEEDYKNLILEHYTFLKRPVVVVDDQIFIGNAKNQVAGAKAALHG